MQIHRLVSPRLLPAAMCALLASCAHGPSQPPEPQVQPPPDYTTSGPTTNANAPKPRLTIQSGEGERLNLPWFIRDAQNAINE